MNFIMDVNKNKYVKKILLLLLSVSDMMVSTVWIDIKQASKTNQIFMMAFVSLCLDRIGSKMCVFVLVIWSVSDLPFSICTVNVINTRCRYFVFIFDLQLR